MTDKEMIELAAKAAGLPSRWWRYVENEAIQGGLRTGLWSDVFEELWNPLTDDGDALQLAVKLEMVVDTMERVIVGSSPSVCVEIDFDEQSACPESAVRRAIVRAAAEVGKEMK